MKKAKKASLSKQCRGCKFNKPGDGCGMFHVKIDGCYRNRIEEGDSKAFWIDPPGKRY